MMGQGMERLEKRLRQDIELIGADYEARIQKLREEEESMKIAHGEEIENLKVLEKYCRNSLRLFISKGCWLIW